MPPQHQGRSIAGAVHDDTIASRPPASDDDDLSVARSHAFEAVQLARGLARGRGAGSAPKERGPQALVAPWRHRGHAIDIRKLALHDACRLEREELLSTHAQCDGGGASEHAVSTGT